MSPKLREAPVTLRAKSTKGERKRLRRAGLIPAVIYGRDVENLLVTVAESLFTRTLRESAWHSTPLKLVLQDSDFSPTAMVGEVQRNIVTQRLISVDFHVVSMEEKVRAEVPVHHVGQHLAVAKGGIVERLSREVMVEALPSDLPRRLEVDISGLDIGDHVKVKDLRLPPGVRVLDSPDETVLTIAAPAKPAAEAVEKEAAVVAETAQPEVIRPREEK